MRNNHLPILQPGAQNPSYSFKVKRLAPPAGLPRRFFCCTSTTLLVRILDNSISPNVVYNEQRYLLDSFVSTGLRSRYSEDTGGFARGNRSVLIRLFRIRLPLLKRAYITLQCERFSLAHNPVSSQIIRYPNHSVDCADFLSFVCRNDFHSHRYRRYVFENISMS